MGPYTLYLSLVYWFYPLNELLGDTGCYVVIYCRNIGIHIIQLHSFFLAIFRYTCLFHENLLCRFDITPNVSIITCTITCIISSITNYKSQNSMSLDQDCLNPTTFVLKNTSSFAGRVRSWVNTFNPSHRIGNPVNHFCFYLLYNYTGFHYTCYI